MSSKTTPEKIRDGLDQFKILDHLEKNLVSISDISDNTISESSKMIEIFEDLPIDRMRKIRPLIEEVQTNRDDLLDALESVEDTIDSMKNLIDSVKKLETYFNEVYLVSVENRKNRSQRGR